MESNVFVEKGVLEELVKKEIGRNHLDEIPASCNAKDGTLFIALSEKEVEKICSIKVKGSRMDSSGDLRAHITNTEITVPVVALEIL